jgi:hypothetical protein
MTTPPSSPSPFTIRPEMVAPRGAYFALLVAAENGPHHGFRRFAARLTMIARNRAELRALEAERICQNCGQPVRIARHEPHIRDSLGR